MLNILKEPGMKMMPVKYTGKSTVKTRSWDTKHNSLFNYTNYQLQNNPIKPKKMDREKTVDVLNELVVINNDRIEGYETAAENSEESDLRALFSKFEQTSHKCRRELIGEIEKLGGKAEEGTKVSGKFFRAWMDVKSALSSNDRKAILNSCEEGEDRAIETYQDVFEDKSKYLTSEQHTMVRDQYNSIKSDQSRIRSMQNALAEPVE